MCVREGREGWQEGRECVSNRGGGESTCDPLTSTVGFLGRFFGLSASNTFMTTNKIIRI